MTNANATQSLVTENLRNEIKVRKDHVVELEASYRTLEAVFGTYLRGPHDGLKPQIQTLKAELGALEVELAELVAAEER